VGRCGPPAEVPVSMLSNLLASGVQYTVQLLELGLVVYLLYRGLRKRHASVLVYLLSLLAVDEVVRRYFFHTYGLNSFAYAYAYWLTDVLLALEAFGLMCIFFRRACTPEFWRTLRLSLIVIFILVAAISFYLLSIHYHKDNLVYLLHDFIYEFEQNLFFTCLVLNTLLFVMLQRIEGADQELGLLVCGMGIQFAGPAASLALVHVTQGWPAAYSLLGYVMPVCTLGMLLVWLYAITATQKDATEGSQSPMRVPIFAEAAGVK
jgi:hypothetical protein